MHDVVKHHPLDELLGSGGLQALKLYQSESCLHFDTILNDFPTSFRLIHTPQITIERWDEKGLDLQAKKLKGLVGRLV